LTLLVYESGRLDGVAAMATNRESRDRAFFLSESTADYCDIVSEPEIRPAVLAAVLAEMQNRRVRDIVLANVPSESHTLRTIKEVADSHGFHLHERPAYDCRVISLRDEDQRHAVLQSVLRKEREKRGLNKLRQLGSIHITHLSKGQLEIALHSIFSAQISRFFATGRFSPLIREPRRCFLIELGRLLGSTGWLKVSQIEVNGRPVAWNYGFRFGDSWFWYLPTFDMQWEEWSPGTCLLRLLTEEACADSSVRRLDLGLGDEAYKDRFANSISSTRYLQLSGSIPGHLSTTVRHGLAAAARRFSFVDKRLRGGKDFFLGVKSRIDRRGVAATVKHALIRAKRSVASMDEIAFFKASEMQVSESESTALHSLGWQDIAIAAMNNADDNETLQYLVRCAKRLRQGRAAGYFLQNESTQGPAHLVWVDSYDGFHLSEINSSLESIDSDAAIIFDCWTPVAQRGHGNYTRAIQWTAARLQRQQKQVWIFSAVENESSVRAILKAGFVYNFSMVRRRTLWRTTVSRSEVTGRQTVSLAN
jgi:CelD/BcsL family acetyltransferase involved in cellulose biosynthesis